MADFRMTCRQCFVERGQSILLKDTEKGWVCPVNSNHQTIFDVEVA